ncbi:restriction endonuclease subunit S [Metallibacterium scheffleri]|uniref:Restriction endonuclease subunit S n=1 Tax=Metallibacterium scheffleri TaxID=993689 RepID=A0A4S3KMQ4_9GAMM|nr:restriction endonuclease subunit S [Metallibacterium scheffleri]THD10096.1 hypothetical protein B1806_09505 [Metallibacterium scheffleri]
MSHYKRYPAYKDSGVEWIGKVPEHWEVKRLRHAAALNPAPEWRELERQQTEYPFLPMEAIGEAGELDVNGRKPLDECRSGYTYFAEGDVVYAKVTPCFENGKGAVIRGLEGGHGFGTTELTVLRATAIDRDYLYALTFADSFRRPGASEMLGSGGLKRVPDEFVRNYRAAIPPIAEQCAIAAGLDRETARIDALIAKKTRFIELLKEKRQALITHAVTKGLDPNVKMKDSGVEWIGEVPEHWEVCRLGSLYREAVRTGDPSLPILSISIHDGITDDELAPEDRDRQIYQIEDRTKYKRVRPNDLAYNMMRAWQGAFGAVAVDGLVSPAYVVAEPSGELRSTYIENLLRTPMAVEEMRRFSRGIADFRMRLYWEYFRDLHVCVPPLDEQDEILVDLSHRGARMERLGETTERSITLLKERRSALITAAVTGKIDLACGYNA